jgi:hypothetical protein
MIKYSLWIKPTAVPNSSFIGIRPLHVPGRLSAHHQEFLDVSGIRSVPVFRLKNEWRPYLIRSDWQIYSATRSRMELRSILLLVQRSSQLHKMYQSGCKSKNSWWWAESLPGTCRGIIPIKLEFGASVGFIHKESGTMHGHMIVKLIKYFWVL